MIFMSVRKNNSFNAAGILFHIGKIGQDQVHPQHIIIGKSHAAVQQEHISLAFKKRHVFANFIQPSEKCYADDWLGRTFALGTRAARAPLDWLLQTCLSMRSFFTMCCILLCRQLLRRSARAPRTVRLLWGRNRCRNCFSTDYLIGRFLTLLFLP